MARGIFLINENLINIFGRCSDSNFLEEDFSFACNKEVGDFLLHEKCRYIVSPFIQN